MESDEKKTNSSISSLSENNEYITNNENIQNLKKNLESMKNVANQNNIQHLNKIFDNIDNYLNIPEELLNSFMEEDIGTKNVRLDDFFFKEKILNLLENKLSLQSYDFFPLFNINNLNNGKKMTCLNVFQIIILEDGQSKKNYYFLATLNNLYFSLYKSNFIINVIDDIPTTLTIISENLNKIERKFKNIEKNKFNVEFYLGEIDNINFSFNETRTKYYNIYYDIKNKCLENDIKDKNNIKNLFSDLEKNHLFLKKIQIEFTKKNKELDGFFFNPINNFLEFENRKIDLPENSFIIVEVKNNSNLKKLKQSVYEKKRIFSCCGINLQNIFFVGILNKIPESGEILNKDTDINNGIIFLTPNLLKFSNKEILLKNNPNFTLKTEINQLTSEFNNFRNYICTQISELKTQINGINENFNKQFKELKNLIQNK